MLYVCHTIITIALQYLLSWAPASYNYFLVHIASISDLGSHFWHTKKFKLTWHYVIIAWAFPYLSNRKKLDSLYFLNFRVTFFTWSLWDTLLIYQPSTAWMLMSADLHSGHVLLVLYILLCIQNSTLNICSYFE